MWYLIVSFVVLVLSVFLGIEISKTNSYILIAYNHWVIETSLWVALVALIVLFIVIYIVFRLLGKTMRINKRFKRWKKMRVTRKARSLTQRGLCELAEGDWSKSEETLLRAAKLSKRPLIDYLGAAKAAQSQHAFDRRDAYLRRAHRSDKEALTAISLTQAQLQIQSEQWEQALSTLQHLHQVKPNHSFVLKLLIEVYSQLNEWEKCEKLLPKIKKHKILSEQKYEAFSERIYFELLTQASNKSPEILIAYWKSLPRVFQQQPAFVIKYVTALIRQKQDETALHMITAFIKKTWNKELIKLYAKLRLDNTQKQLQQAEQWYSKHPHDPALLLCLGQLCMREKLWGKARDYLQQSIQQQPSSQAYYELGQLYEILNDKDASQNCFRKALTQVG